jgi:hypothetical protein
MLLLVLVPLLLQFLITLLPSVAGTNINAAAGTGTTVAATFTTVPDNITALCCLLLILVRLCYSCDCFFFQYYYYNIHFPSHAVLFLALLLTASLSPSFRGLSPQATRWGEGVVPPFHRMWNCRAQPSASEFRKRRLPKRFESWE